MTDPDDLSVDLADTFDRLDIAAELAQADAEYEKAAAAAEHARQRRLKLLTRWAALHPEAPDVKRPQRQKDLAQVLQVSEVRAGQLLKAVRPRTPQDDTIV